MTSGEETPGYELAFLLLGAFRRVIDDLHLALAERGFPDARPAHGFALQAIGSGAVTVTELGRRLGVSKQAAAKSVKTLERLDYVTRSVDPDDARATLVRRSARGIRLLNESAAIFEEQQQEWVTLLGADGFDALLDSLRQIDGGASLGDVASWLQTS